jgi:hypothetical protein
MNRVMGNSYLLSPSRAAFLGNSLGVSFGTIRFCSEELINYSDIPYRLTLIKLVFDSTDRLDLRSLAQMLGSQAG